MMYVSAGEKVGSAQPFEFAETVIKSDTLILQDGQKCLHFKHVTVTPV